MNPVSTTSSLPIYHKHRKSSTKKESVRSHVSNNSTISNNKKVSNCKELPEEFIENENNKTYVHSFGTSRSWTNLSQYESSNPSSSSGHTIPRVTYRRLEKIASYHYLPRVVLYSNNGTLKKSQSHQNFAARERNDGSNTQWEI